MDVLRVALDERSYPIYFSADEAVYRQLATHIGGRYTFIVSNKVVAPHYLEPVLRALPDDLQCDYLLLEDGEEAKTLANVERVVSALITRGHPRNTTLIALGGGVIGDLTGFVAACYQRGVPFIQIPTTLLAQVDSSVGGKTAVNHPLAKNMIGAFHQPEAVLMNLASLATLPAREFSAGMAEVIKYGVIADADFFGWLETLNPEQLKQSPALLQRMIRRCCELKAAIVSADEREQGKRALLNLGHTFGHAIEAHGNYKHYLHGEAVAIGMLLAAKLAQQRGQFSASEYRRLERLLRRWQLPLMAPTDLAVKDFIALMWRDKKVLDRRLRLVLPCGLGRAHVADDVSEAELDQLLRC